MEKKDVTMIDPSLVPNGQNVKEITKRIVTLNKVIFEDGEQDLKVEVIPFDKRNDMHVEFAYAVSDMLMRAPSPYKSVSDASRDYVRIFMVHTKEDEKNPDSDFNAVLNDLRASRTLFNSPDTQMELNDFFGVA